jgi:hypothetical protein
MMRAESGLGAIGGRAKPPALGWAGLVAVASPLPLSLLFPSSSCNNCCNLLQLELQTAQLLPRDNILYIPTRILEECMRST